MLRCLAHEGLAGDLGRDYRDGRRRWNPLERGGAYQTRSEFEGTYYIGAAKTAAGVRRVSLSPDALAVVQDMRGRVQVEARQVERYQGQGTAAGAPVFAAVDGRPMRQDVARAVMRRTCEGAGVPLLSPHALRHSVGTALIARGADPVSVSKHLGHAQVSTTLNI